MDDGSRGAGGWLFAVHVVKQDVSEGGDIEEVEDVMVFLDINVKGFVVKPLISEYGDDWEEAVHPSVKGLGQK
jgi:hypothetical protein